jgi:hypothetical protein
LAVKCDEIFGNGGGGEGVIIGEPKLTRQLIAREELIGHHEE